MKPSKPGEKEGRKGMMRSRDIFIIAIIAAFLAMVFGKLLTGCGLEKDKKVIVEQAPLPEPPPVVETPQCEGNPVSAVQKLACPKGQKGEIVEVCRDDGKWYEASNSCVQDCDEKVPTWDNDIESIIVTNCTECHGGYRKYEAVAEINRSKIDGKGEIFYYVDLPDSDDNHMPKFRPNLPQAEVDLIEAWTLAGMPKSGECSIESASIDLDYLETHMLEFLSDIPDDADKANYRFFTMAHKYNQEIALENEFKAFNRGINSISFDNEVYLCKPIDPKGALCVIDIRSLKLTRHVFALIEQADKVKFISNTTKGQIIRQLTKTDQPMFHHDVIIDTVFDTQELYYEIMGFKDFKQILSVFGIDFDVQVAVNDYKLIGTNESDISAGRNTRLIAIFEGEINGFDTSCHISFDNPALDGAEFDLFQSPFLDGTDPGITQKIFAFTASELICGLPNKMHAYALVNNQGVLQNAAPEEIVFCNRPNCLDPTIENGIDCLNCHVEGYLPEIDVIGDHIRGSRQFNDDEIKLAKQIYLDNGRNAATFNLHNSWYREAMEKVGRTEGETDHLTAGQLVYLNRQTLEQAAAFVFTEPELLKACIEGSQQLVTLLGGLITGAKVTHDTLLQALPVLLDECELAEDAILAQ